MPEVSELVANIALLFTVGLLGSGLAGIWLLGRAKGRREGLEEAHQMSAPGDSSIREQNERIDTLLLEVTRLRENQSQMSKVLRVAVQNSQQSPAR